MQKQKCINPNKIYPRKKCAKNHKLFDFASIGFERKLFGVWFTIAFIVTGKYLPGEKRNALWESFYLAWICRWNLNFYWTTAVIVFKLMCETEKKVTGVISKSWILFLSLFFFSVSLLLLSTSVALRQRKWKSLVHIFQPIKLEDFDTDKKEWVALLFSLGPGLWSRLLILQMSHSEMSLCLSVSVCSWFFSLIGRTREIRCGPLGFLAKGML